MTIARTAYRFTGVLALSLLLTPPASFGATTRKRAASVAPRSAAGSNAIIDLPLTPIVPLAQRSCATRLPSGLGVTVLRAASGAKPAGDATALVNYIGYLAANGVVFDQAMRTPLALDGVIPGFSQGLQMLPRSGVIRLCIPAALGYGARAQGPIPANADLVFQIELLDFKTSAEIEDMRKSQVADPGPQSAVPQTK